MYGCAILQSWATCLTFWYCLMLQLVTRTLPKPKSVEKERGIVCGHHLWIHSLFGDCIAGASPVHLFAPKQVKLIHKHLRFLTGWTDIPEAQWAWCYNVMIKCSHFSLFIYYYLLYYTLQPSCHCTYCLLPERKHWISYNISMCVYLWDHVELLMYLIK